MEKRVLIAVLLSFLVLYAYQAMFPPPPDQAKKPVQASKAATAPTASAPAVANPAPSPEATDAASEREIAIDNADVHGVFSTRGGVLKSWQLKKYRDDHGRPYELIAGHAPADAPLPLTLAVDDAALSTTLATAPFTASESGSGASWQVQFDYDANGVRAQKRIAIDASKPYVLNVSRSVTRDGQALPATLKWGPAL